MLEAGSYVLLCNIWDEEEGKAHYSGDATAGDD